MIMPTATSHMEAVRVVDNCSTHRRSGTLQLLTNHEMKIIICHPPTNQIFQSRELSVLVNLQKKINSRLPVESDQMMGGFIKRISHVMKQTLVEDIVQHAFIQLELSYEIETSACLLLFDEPMLRQSRAFI
jgi:hypothetical protein